MGDDIVKLLSLVTTFAYVGFFTAIIIFVGEIREKARRDEFDHLLSWGRIKLPEEEHPQAPADGADVRSSTESSGHD
jgi:hypothetical protein